MKKSLALLLTVAMMVTSSVGVIAADKTIAATGDNTYTSSTEVDLVGNITNDAVIISVIMPTSVDFAISLVDAAQTVAAEGDAAVPGKIYDTLISADGVVTNNSNKPIKLEITDVQDTKKILDMIDLGLDVKGTAASEVKYLDPIAMQTTPVQLVSSIAAKGGVTTLNVFGKGKFLDDSLSVQQPADLKAFIGTQTVTTTLKISVAQ